MNDKPELTDAEFKASLDRAMQRHKDTRQEYWPVTETNGPREYLVTASGELVAVYGPAPDWNWEPIGPVADIVADAHRWQTRATQTTADTPGGAA